MGEMWRKRRGGLWKRARSLSVVLQVEEGKLGSEHKGLPLGITHCENPKPSRFEDTFLNH